MKKENKFLEMLKKAKAKKMGKVINKDEPKVMKPKKKKDGTKRVSKK